MLHEKIKHLKKNDKLSAIAHSNLAKKYSKKYATEKSNKKKNFILMEYHNMVFNSTLRFGKLDNKEKKIAMDNAKRLASYYYG